MPLGKRILLLKKAGPLVILRNFRKGTELFSQNQKYNDESGKEFPSNACVILYNSIGCPADSVDEMDYSPLTSASAHERFGFVRILIGNYEPETGTQLLHAFDVEKSLQVRALMIIALFPAWIPLVDRAWQSREAWPLSSTETSSALTRLCGCRLPCIERHLEELLKTDHIATKLQLLDYYANHFDHSVGIQKLYDLYESKALEMRSSEEKRQRKEELIQILELICKLEEPL